MPLMIIEQFYYRALLNFKHCSQFDFISIIELLFLCPIWWLL